jgi:hypothetical protein
LRESPAPSGRGAAAVASAPAGPPKSVVAQGTDRHMVGIMLRHVSEVLGVAW